MSQVIDWSRYGRSKRQKPKWEVTYSGDETQDGFVVTAVFPIECLEEVMKHIKAQRDFWEPGESPK